MGRPRKQKPSTTLEEKLVEESKVFVEAKKDTLQLNKPVSPKQQIAALIFAGLLSRGGGYLRKEELRKEAYELAEFILEVED